MATVTPAAGADFTIDQFVEFLNGLIYNSAISNRTSSSFTANWLGQSNENFSATVSGSGLSYTYNPQAGGYYLSGGTIQTVTGSEFTVGALGVISNINLAASQMLAAVTAESTGSNFQAIEELLLSQDWIYTSSGSGEFVTADSYIGDGAAWNPIGNDQFILGNGNDSLYSGDGNDLLKGAGGDDTLDGGTGFDRAVYTGNQIDYQISQTTSQALSGGFTITDLRAGSPDGTDSIENIEEVQFADGIIAASALLSASGPTNGDDVLVGDEFNNVINGLAGNDSIDGADGDDTLIGGSGNDQLIGAGGNDTIDGGTDNGFPADTAVYSGNRADYQITLAANGSFIIQDLRALNLDGTDTVSNVEFFSFIDQTVAAADLLSTGVSTEPSSGNDVLDGDEADNEIDGLAGDDIINGHGGFDLLFGSGGNDTLNGGTGNDFLDGGSGADILNGGAGIDAASYDTATGTVVVYVDAPSLNYGDAAGDQYSSIEAIIGSFYNDFIYGSNVNGDIIFGQDGIDTIYGYGGNDEIHGGGGYDILYGGEGDDFIYGDNGVGLLVGQAGNDTITGGADFDQLYGGTGNDTLNGGEAGDYLFGEADSDTLNGDGGNDFLYGQAGDDTLNGGAGIDVLQGGDGSDTLFGGDDGTQVPNGLFGDAGNDFLIGGTGIDYMTGGTGNDTFTFTTNGYVDVVTDFELGDAIRIIGTDLTSFDDLLASDSLSQVGNYTAIYTSGNNAPGIPVTDIVYLQDVDFNDLTAADFVFV